MAIPKSANATMLLGALLSILFWSGNLLAQQSPIQLDHKAEQSETYIDASGTEQTRFVEATKVLPGEEIRFTVTYSNNGTEPAENIIITNPVPDNMNYIDNSASGNNTDISFSVNGGESYALPQELTVADAQGSQKPASAVDYTHIRWIVATDVAPGSDGTVQFTAYVE